MIPGLVIRYDIIDRQTEDAIVSELDADGWSTDLSRKTIQYGTAYNYRTRRTGSSNVLPIKGKILELIGTTSTFNQVICNEYTRKQGIAPHVDSTLFGNIIFGLSLLEPTVMTFRNPEIKVARNILLPARSLYIMYGEARYKWTHSISPRVNITADSGERVTKGTNYRRISVTYRSVI